MPLKHYLTLEHFKAWVPIIVVLLTALLSGYLVPKITKGWQDHQKELEIKTSLVEAINNEFLQFLLAMQLVERKALEQAKFNEAYVRWEIQRGVISGKLKSYFGKQKVSVDFDGLSEAITEFYALAGIYNQDIRSKHIIKLKEYFGDNATDWQKLADLKKRESNFFDWFCAWWALRQEALARKDALIQNVLSTPIAFFRT